MSKINLQDGFMLLKLVLIVVIIATLAIGVGFYFVSRNKSQPSLTSQNNSQRILDKSSPILKLKAQNNSNLDSQYRLIAVGSPTGISSQTKVVLSATNAVSGVSMPAHVHDGSCAQLGGVKYPLANVVNGRSETLLNTSLLQLKFDLPLAINIHKSTAEPGIYIACIDLNADGLLDVLTR